MVQQKILEKLFDTISHEPITFNKLCRASKIHPMTVRAYLKMIIWVQKQEKVEIERRDFRVIIRRLNIK